jgi:hypothetical protein
MTSSNSQVCDLKCHFHITRFMISCAELLCADRAVGHPGQILSPEVMLVDSPSGSALQEEVNSVMAKLRSYHFEITAVHNHLMGETPKVFYVHYMAHGSASQLATSLHTALAVSKTPLEKPAAAAEEPAPPAWVKSVEDAVGRKGTLKVECCHMACRAAIPSRWRE